MRLLTLNLEEYLRMKQALKFKIPKRMAKKKAS
jgi:hypothetical protein